VGEGAEALPEALLADLVAARAASRALAVVTTPATWDRHLVAPGQDPATDARFRSDRSGMEEDGRFIAIHNPPLRLIVIGAVHIAQPLLAIARTCGYAPTLIDPRAAFGSADRFPGETILDDWPDEALAALKPDARTAIVTLTHDPKLDDPAIRFALTSPAFYLGCLGSTRTHAKRVERLTEAGFTPDQIAKIHAPVGLDIGAKTPAEIAVSVMAQITQALRK
jgi:xanthine dehydrogenase accessory factor